MDILEELPIEQWPLLQEKLKGLWPLNMPGYYSLQVNLTHPAVRETFDFRVYCPHGNMDSGFIGISVKNSQALILFSITEDTSKLEEALLKTKLINWKSYLIFQLVNSLTLPILERMGAVMQFDKFHIIPAKLHVLGANSTSYPELSLPAGTYMSSVKVKHIERVNDTWPYKYSYSYTLFKTLAANGLSYGLYLSDTDELLAWVFVNEYHYLSHFYCEEKHRRRGYGEYVMYYALDDLIKDGRDAYAYVVDGNENPLKIFHKLGFKIVDNTAIVFTKNCFTNLTFYLRNQS